MIKNVNHANKKDFETLLNNFWKGASLADCKKDASTTGQFLYYINGKAVGLLTCSIKKEYVPGCNTGKVAYLEGLYILPEYRRQGFATKLVEQFEKWAQKHGCKEMASDIEIDNDISLQFHNKMGFEIVEKTIHLKKIFKEN